MGIDGVPAFDLCFRNGLSSPIFTFSARFSGFQVQPWAFFFGGGWCDKGWL